MKKIREEKLELTKKYIEQYGNNKDFMKTNVKTVNTIIKDLEDNNKTIFVNAFGFELTIDELKEMRKLYKNALKKDKSKIGNWNSGAIHL